MSTYGQLRFLLQTQFSGVPVDLLDGYLNGRLEQVLEAGDWTGVKYHTTLQTQAAYQSAADTVTLQVGLATVAGQGTAWTKALVGQRFYQPGDTAVYTVIAVASAISLTLDRPYEGRGPDLPPTQYLLASYVFMQNIYTLPPDVRTVVSILDPVSGLPLQKFSKDNLDASVGPRTLINDPQSYAVYDDSNEATPPVLHQVEFYPPPLYARGFPVEYLHSGTGFDGATTNASPMPWISDSVLLEGCRADICMYLAGEAATPAQANVHIAQADRYEKKYLTELAKLLMEEHARRRQKTALQMAPRFVRHRMTRAARGWGLTWRGGTPGGPNRQYFPPCSLSDWGPSLI
jgi:hypothetical protein